MKKLLVWLYWLALASCLAVTTYFHVHLPPPGIAIACLAIAAVVMTLKETMPEWQKCVWIIVTFALFVVEIRAIRNDREQYSKQHASDLAAQQSQFELSINTQQSEFAQSMTKFSILLNSVNDIRDIDQKLAANRAKTARPSLKSASLQIAKEILQFVDSRAQIAPSGPEPLFPKSGQTPQQTMQDFNQYMAPYDAEQNKFDQDLASAWNDRFLDRVTNITQQLKQRGVMPPYINSCQIGGKSLFLLQWCAKHIEEAASKLK
ncbi:MAG: hypothetical protein ACYDCD_00570 [Candidatus Acidiferrales bacterium]